MSACRWSAALALPAVRDRLRHRAAGRLVVSADLIAAAQRGDALATSDALEALIERGADAPGDREYAYEIVCKQSDRHRRGTRSRARPSRAAWCSSAGCGARA